MARYRIYNPFNEVGVHPTSLVRSLPAETQGDIEARLEAALSAHHSGADLAERVNLRMNSQIKELEDVIDVGAVLDKWAATASFDPERVTVEKAAWLLVRKDGEQAVLMASLKSDPSSPCGHAWERTVFEWKEAFDGSHSWFEDFLGAYWGFDDAYELKHDIPWPEGFDVHNTEMVRIEPRFAEEDLDVWGDGPHEPRLARTNTENPLADEVRAMSAIDWSQRDKPAFPYLFFELAGPEDTIAEPLVAKAADMDVKLECISSSEHARLAVRGTITDPEGRLVAAKALMVDARGLASAQRNVYQGLFEQTRERWSGIANPSDGEKPFEKFAQAALAHYGIDHSADATRPVVRDVSGRLPMPKQSPPDRMRRTVADDARVAQESARAQSKSAPRQIVDRARKL